MGEQLFSRYCPEQPTYDIHRHASVRESIPHQPTCAALAAVWQASSRWCRWSNPSRRGRPGARGTSPEPGPGPPPYRLYCSLPYRRRSHPAPLMKSVPTPPSSPSRSVSLPPSPASSAPRQPRSHPRLPARCRCRRHRPEAGDGVGGSNGSRPPPRRLRHRRCRPRRPPLPRGLQHTPEGEGGGRLCAVHAGGEGREKAVLSTRPIRGHLRWFSDLQQLCPPRFPALPPLTGRQQEGVLLHPAISKRGRSGLLPAKD